VGPRATHFTGYCWFMCLGETLYWVLLLVYVGPRATHITGPQMPQRRPFQNCIARIMMNKDYKLNTLQWITGYCCWLCCASGTTPYWLLLLAYEGPRTTHLNTGYCCGLCEVLGNTL
jgi:hypothetical protein